MAMGYDGSIRIDSRIDTKGFNSGISSMGATLKKLGALIGVTFAVASVIAFGRSAVQAASNLASALVGLESVTNGVGISFSDAQKFINEYTADGLIPATDAIIAFKNLALRGYNVDQIKAVMIALKDASAFGRQSSYTMGEAVRSASEGLKNENSILVDNAGVTKNVAKMWLDYARAHGIAVTSMTQAQKIEAEVNGIMEETRFQTGDAAKATGTFAGMMSALGVSFLSLKVAVGNAIIPVLQQIIPYIKAVIDWLTALFTTFATFVQVLFGVKVGAEQAGSGLGDMGDEAQQAGQQTGGAGKAAKGALAAFDELNVLAQDSGGGGANPPGPGEGGLLPIDPEETGGTLDAVAEKVAAFKEKLMALLTPAIEAFGRLKEALTPLGETIWKGLKWAWDNILVPLGKWVITELLPAFLDLLAGAATLLNTVLLALEPAWTWFWENILKPIAEWTGGAIITILGWFTTALYGISDWISNNQTLFNTLMVFLGTFAAGVALIIIGVYAYIIAINIATIATGIFAGIVGFLTSPVTLVLLAIAALAAIIYLLISYWPQISAAAQAAWDWIVSVWQVVADWFNTNVIQPVVAWFTSLWTSITTAAQTAWNWILGVWTVVANWFNVNVITPLRNFFQGMWDWLSIVAYDVWLVIQYIWQVVAEWFSTNVIEPLQTFFDNAWQAISGFFSSAWTTISELWGTVSTWFSENVITPVSDFFSGLWEDIQDFASTAWDEIVKIWETVSTWFKTNVIDPLSDGFNTLLYGEDGKGGIVGAWTTAWDTIKAVLKGIINGIIGLLNGVISGIVSGINGIIDAANTAGSVLPGWKDIPHLVAPQIPELATGAVIPPNAQFLALLGDQRSGKNIEAPEALIRQIVREEAGGGSDGNIRIDFGGSMAELVRILKPEIDKENTRVGRSMVVSVS